MESGIPVGSSSYSLGDLTVHLHRPEGYTKDSAILVVAHGRNRNGDEYRDYFVAESNARGFLVVAPNFSEDRYPHPHAYNYGGMVDAAGKLAPHRRWMFWRLKDVFDDVRRRIGAKRKRFFLFGHSAGSQLVHRMATFDWIDGIEGAVAANAGSYTMPVRGVPFPFGLDGVQVTDDDLRKLFSRPLVVLLGDADVNPGDEHLPREPQAMQQGPHRFARGQRYFETAKREAQRVGVPLAWRLAIAPGVGHSGRDMAPFAVKELGL